MCKHAHRIEFMLESAGLSDMLKVKLKNLRKALDTFNFGDTLWEQFCLSDQSALVDASLWRKSPQNLCKSSSTRPENSKANRYENEMV